MAKRSSTFDLGQQTLKMYRKLMSIDDAWLEPQERGFSWWSGPLAQQVWASPPWQDQEGDIFQLVAETDICTGGTTEDLATALDGVMGLVPLSCIVRDRETGTLRLRCSVVLHTAVAPRLQKLFCHAASLQQSLAYQIAPILTEKLGSHPAVSDHPKSGRRPDFDEMANIASNLFQPMGERPSAWNDRSEHAAVASSLSALGVIATTDHPMGQLCVGLGVGDTQGPPPGAVGPAMLVLHAEEELPFVGKGAAIVLIQPPGFAKTQPPPTSLDLNGWETAEPDHPHVLGSWAGSPSETSGDFFHTCFLPNAVYAPGLLLDLFVAMAARARWAERVLAAIPHDAIADNMTFAGLAKSYTLAALKDGQ